MGFIYKVALKDPDSKHEIYAYLNRSLKSIGKSYIVIWGALSSSSQIPKTEVFVDRECKQGNHKVQALEQVDDLHYSAPMPRGCGEVFSAYSSGTKDSFEPRWKKYCFYDCPPQSLCWNRVVT